MKAALEQPGKRKRVSVVVSLHGREGRRLASFVNSAVADAGEMVAVQFRMMPLRKRIQTMAETDEQQEVQESQDDEIVAPASENFSEVRMAGTGRTWHAWFWMWKDGSQTDAQVEQQWGVEFLMEFQATLA